MCLRRRATPFLRQGLVSMLPLLHLPCSSLILIMAFAQGRNYVFTTEGHPIPVLSKFHDPSAAPALLQRLPLQPRVLVPVAVPPPQTIVVTPDHT